LDLAGRIALITGIGRVTALAAELWRRSEEAAV
jgi:hypothetical protein